MSIAPAGLLTVEAARDAVLAVAEPVGTETVAAADALGRITAETVTALVSLPPWPNSAMDGYAIVAADATGAAEALPVTLRVIGDIAAGAAPTVAVTRGTAVRIATGARLPAGADAVVPVEATTPLDEAGRLGSRGRDATGPPPTRSWSTRPFRPAAPCARRGAISRPARCCSSRVGRSPRPRSRSSPGRVSRRCGSTGCLGSRSLRRATRSARRASRSVRPGSPNANGPGLRALVTAAGGEAIDLGIATDDLDDVLGRLREGLAQDADALIVSGGVSVGPYDVVKTAIESIGRIDLWRVAVQPGKPFAFGVAERPGGGPPVLLFGLPGNPVSSAVTFELFVRPAIRALAGRLDVLRPVDRAVLGEAVSKSHGRRAFLRVEAERDDTGAPVRDGRGRVRVHLAGGQGSHVISALAAADALAVIPEADDELPAGAEVALWWLDRA